MNRTFSSRGLARSKHGLIYWAAARQALFLALWLPGLLQATQPINLETTPATVQLSTGDQTFRFTRRESTWAFDSVVVRGKTTAQSLTRADGFFIGGGEAGQCVVLTNGPEVKAIRFILGTNSVTYQVDARDRLPRVHIRLDGPDACTCSFRTATAESQEHGAWVTRGYVATDLDGHEDFVDGSNPLIFGHSLAGDVDAYYLFMPVVRPRVQKNGRTEQRANTWFKSMRGDAGNGRFYGYWHLRIGPDEPKEFALLFDRDLGGRLSDICEKCYADAVDTLVDVSAVPLEYDPDRCMEVMPVRLAAPDAFIPGWGWMMDEFPGASYPFAHDSVWQQPALLAFEGLATGRAWERNFARYLIARSPLEGRDGTSYFVRRPGGLTRWTYFATYKNPFPPFQGGTWWHADLLYRTALALADDTLRGAAVDMVRHDVDVKLDLDKMTYPPCWDAVQNRMGDDHRDDWFQTPGLAYCAYAASRIAYPETKDSAYLAKADRICEWFAAQLGPETKLNFLQGSNMHAVFSHYIALAFLDKFERSGDRRYLDLARDMAWIHIMTSCTTATKDAGGHPMTGTTCVGVRGCVDYDCAPNLCHEKDLTFVHLIGPLLDHVQGPAYAKYLELQRLVLPKDSWKSAWATELRDTNLRTMYDTFARGMANLIYGLNRSQDGLVVAVEKLASKGDTNIVHARDLVLANGTRQDRQTTLEIRYLAPGAYEWLLNGISQGRSSHLELAKGLPLHVPANTMKRIQVRPDFLAAPASVPDLTYDYQVTFLNALEPFAGQRGTGLPQPIYRRDRSLDDPPHT